MPLDAIIRKCRRLKNKVKFVLRYFYLKVRYCPLFSPDVVSNRVFFMTYDSQFICNPAYITKELIRRNKDVEIYWVTTREILEQHPDAFPPEVHTVFRPSREMFHAMATSRVWVDNALNCVWYGMPKKKEQVYLNTWHGSLGIKKLAGNKNWMRRAARCNGTTDYCITNSTFEDMVFRTTFWPDVPKLHYGHARNDVFFDQELIAKASDTVHSYYNIPSDRKLFLYAPTFRDDGDTSCFNLDYARVKAALEKRFGGNWVILVRAHFKNRNSGGIMTEFGPDLVDAAGYPDMQELMLGIDVGCTDYSSWAYDFVLSGKPMFLYAEDKAKYENDRGLYYTLDETPFPVADSNDAMEACIESFDPAVYKEHVAEFLDGKGCIDDGHASERIVDFILDVMENGKPDPETLTYTL